MQKRDRQLCLTACKCLHGLAPPYLTRFCTPLSAVAGRTHLCSADQHKLFVRRTSTSTFGSRAFSSSSPLSWNALPPHLRDPVTQPSPSASSDSPWKLIFSTILIDSVSLLFCTFIGFLQFRHRTRFRDSFCLASVFKFLFTYLLTYLRSERKWFTSHSLETVPCRLV